MKKLLASVALGLLPLLAQGGSRAADPLALRVLLLGDAGSPDPAGEPVLVALASEVQRDPARTLIVYLGDNVYPRGLPPVAAPDRPEMERRLDAQLDVGRRAGVRTVFIPGNHDWDSEGPDGWAAVRRQGERIARRGGGLAELRPRDGCPGPDVVDLPALRLIVLDTQWWLHEGPRPEHPRSSCSTDSVDEIVGELKNALASAAGPALVVGHHPLATGGPHGGKFSWRQHFFPLTDVKKGLWLPLPGVGSIYPWARKGGATDQDLAGKRNRAMRAALEGAFEAHPPLAYVAGHEHSLQVLRKGSLRLLVSGNGFYDHGTPVYNVAGTVFRSSKAGFMRIDVDVHGGARLAVIEVERSGQASTAHAETLR